MTPKDKANELYCKYYNEFNFDEVYNGSKKQSKECAIIAVDEIISSEPTQPSDVNWDFVGGNYEDYHKAERREALEFWQQVKQELLKL